MEINYYDVYQRHPSFSDEFFGQFLRTLGKSYTQCADVGECYATLNKIVNDDGNSWYEAWHEIAQFLEESAESSLKRGHKLSASYTFFRAAEYYRASEFFLRATPQDERILPVFDRLKYCFERALAGTHYNYRSVAAPYEKTSLKGYLFLPKEAKATLIVPSGYDSTVEEMYSLVPRSLEQGYAILIFDAPGQGHFLRREKVYMRPDFEYVVDKLLNWADTQSDINKNYVLVGRSFGGYLVPRAACFEARVKAFIADPGQLDIAGASEKLLPAALREPFKAGDKLVVNAFFAKHFEEEPMKGFFFKSRMAVHGVETPYDYLVELRKYTFVEHVHKIKCLALICDNPSDKISGRGNALYDAITAEKRYVRFEADRGAGMHCEADANGQFFQVIFDWLDEQFS